MGGELLAGLSAMLPEMGGASAASLGALSGGTAAGSSVAGSLGAPAAAGAGGGFMSNMATGLQLADMVRSPAAAPPQTRGPRPTQTPYTEQQTAAASMPAPQYSFEQPPQLERLRALYAR